MSSDEQYSNSDDLGGDLSLVPMHSRSEFINCNLSQHKEIDNSVGLEKNTVSSPFEMVSSFSYLQASHYDKVTNKTSLKSQKPWQYLCDVCGRFYTHSSYFFQHLQFHREAKPFSCTEPYCNKIFTTVPDVNDHIRKCYTSLYHCAICGKPFLADSVCCPRSVKRSWACTELGRKCLDRNGTVKNGLCYSKNLRKRRDRNQQIRAPVCRLRILKLYKMVLLCSLAMFLFTANDS